MSKILESMHATAKGLYEAGGMDAVTMCNMDDLCLPPVQKISAKQIKQLRIASKVSQDVNVKPVTVKK